MKIFITTIIVFFFTFEASALELLLKCGKEEVEDKTYILIKSKLKTAHLIENDPVVDGFLEVTSTFYKMNFPKTKKTYHIGIKINRYTGKFEWEHGNDPFWEFSVNNVYRSGICEESKAQKKF